MNAVIVVPIVPAPACSPNWHGSWYTKAAATKELRRAAYMATVDALNTPGTGVSAFCGYYGLVVLDLEIAWNGRRSGMDDDNAKASCKGLIDGVSDALWQSRDGHVVIGDLVQKRGDGSVTVTLRGSS